MMNRLTSKYFWKRIWKEQVSTRIHPRQRWLTKQIPRTWRDPDFIIETCVFASLIYWWEEDGGEETCRYQWQADYSGDYHMSPEEVDNRVKECKEIYDRLLAAYNWAKTGRVEAEKKYDDLLTKNYGSFNAFNRSKEALKETTDAEVFLINQDTFFLKEIVELRKYMWT